MILNNYNPIADVIIFFLIESFKFLKILKVKG